VVRIKQRVYMDGGGANDLQFKKQNNGWDEPARPRGRLGRNLLVVSIEAQTVADPGHLLLR